MLEEVFLLDVDGISEIAIAHCGKRNDPVVRSVEKRPGGVPSTALSVPDDEEEEGEEEGDDGEH